MPNHEVIISVIQYRSNNILRFFTPTTDLLFAK